MVKEVTVNKSLKDILDKAGPINNSNIKIANLEDQPQHIDEQINEWKNKYLYLQADLENVKRRYNKQIDDLHKYEGENIFKDILPILDNLEYSQNDDIDILNSYNALIKVFWKYGVKPIYQDRPIYFNEEYDEAISSVDTNDPNLDNTINKVYQRGYFYKDKVLRYEKVIVNKYKDNNE